MMMKRRSGSGAGTMNAPFSVFFMSARSPLESIQLSSGGGFPADEREGLADGQRGRDPAVSWSAAARLRIIQLG
jgi:hypothetical protein